MYMGQQLRMLFDGEKAALLQQIDSELEKVPLIDIHVWCTFAVFTNHFKANSTLNTQQLLEF